MDESDLESVSRRAIYQHIATHPGLHFRELEAELAYAKGTLQYQLRWLDEEGIVEVRDDGKYTRYYPAAEYDEIEQTVIDALRRKYSRRILAHLLSEEALSTTELSERIDKAPSTISWHLSKLADADLISKRQEGRSVVYEVNDPTRVKYLYTVHQKSFTDRVVDEILDLWESY